MFSWITGPRITNVAEDLQPDPAYESTFIEPPDTPAHQFAVKAFKHALFGTPAPAQRDNQPGKAQKSAKHEVGNAKAPDLAATRDDAPASSPSKQPKGVLMTPGTASKGKKTVSFGAHVVDNEGKRAIGKSGVPNDCPGKFPSPWTPATQSRLDVGSDKKPRTKLTEALLDARTTVQPKSGQKPKARDDSDITIDLGAPRSESGKYWKDQYEAYAERSEKEMKKIVAKQQLAKNYAKKKDGEMTEVVTRLEQERKRFRQRERDLEQQNKDLQERLRKAMGENMSASMEIAALKSRIAVLEKSAMASSSEMQNDKASFQIFEDLNKEIGPAPSEQKSVDDLSDFALPSSSPFPDKENSPPKLRHTRRQTLPDTFRPSTARSERSRIDPDTNQPSIMIAKSPHAPTSNSKSSAKPSPGPTFPNTSQNLLSPSNAQKPELSKENLPPKSPGAELPSSPLPQPSPGLPSDPWLELDSSLPQMDRMAMPISSGPSYSRPARNTQPRERAHRVSKSVPHTSKEVPSSRHQNEKPISTEKEVGAPKSEARSTGTLTKRPTSQVADATDIADITSKADTTKAAVPPRKPSSETSTNKKPDVSKAAHHAEGSSQVKKDRVELLPVDRKEQARRRLQARKEKKLAAA